jgi:hypothetical protein
VKKISTLFIPMFILLFAANLNFAGTGKDRRPCHYLIPEGYVGWVQINFGLKDAPPIPIENEARIFKFSESGLIETSDTIEYGSAKDYFFYYSGEGKTEFQQPNTPGILYRSFIGYVRPKSENDMKRSEYNWYFIGTDEEYKKYGIPRLNMHKLSVEVGNVKTAKKD